MIEFSNAWLAKAAEDAKDEGTTKGQTPRTKGQRRDRRPERRGNEGTDAKDKGTTKGQTPTTKG